MIGDINQATILSSALPLFDDILKEKGERKFLQDEGLLVDEIISSSLLVNWNINVSDNRISKSYKEEQPNIELNLSGLECFDGYFIFLIEHNGYDHLLCRDHIEGKNYDFKLPKNYFHKTIASLVKEIRASTYLAVRDDSSLKRL